MQLGFAGAFKPQPHSPERMKNAESGKASTLPSTTKLSERVQALAAILALAKLSRSHQHSPCVPLFLQKCLELLARAKCAPHPRWSAHRPALTSSVGRQPGKVPMSKISAKRINIDHQNLPVRLASCKHGKLSPQKSCSPSSIRQTAPRTRHRTMAPTCRTTCSTLVCQRNTESPNAFVVTSARSILGSLKKWHSGVEFCGKPLQKASPRQTRPPENGMSREPSTSSGSSSPGALYISSAWTRPTKCSLKTQIRQGPLACDQITGAKRPRGKYGTRTRTD